MVHDRLDPVPRSYKSCTKKKKRKWEMKNKEEILREKMKKLVNICINNYNIVNQRISKHEEINNIERRWINRKEEEKEVNFFALFKGKSRIYENIIAFFIC